jgi:hypothetical protein
LIPGIVTDGSNIGKADYVHPVIEALKELDKSLLLLRLEDGSYINWEDKQSGHFRMRLHSSLKCFFFFHYAWFFVHFKIVFNFLCSFLGGLDCVLMWHTYGYAEPHRVGTLFEAAVEALEKLGKLCIKTEPENAQIAVKYGGVETSIQAYYAVQTYRMSWGSLALRVLLSLIAGDFKALMSVLRKHHY